MISKPYEPRDAVLVRLPRHLKDGLRLIAAEHQRSMSGEVNFVVADYVRSHLNPRTEGTS